MKKSNYKKDVSKDNIKNMLPNKKIKKCKKYLNKRYRRRYVYNEEE